MSRTTVLRVRNPTADGGGDWGHLRLEKRLYAYFKGICRPMWKVSVSEFVRTQGKYPELVWYFVKKGEPMDFGDIPLIDALSRINERTPD